VASAGMVVADMIRSPCRTDERADMVAPGSAEVKKNERKMTRHSCPSSGGFLRLRRGCWGGDWRNTTRGGGGSFGVAACNLGG
jgi:hypothetical protein